MTETIHALTIGPQTTEDWISCVIGITIIALFATLMIAARRQTPHQQTATPTHNTTHKTPANTQQNTCAHATISTETKQNTTNNTNLTQIQ